MASGRVDLGRPPGMHVLGAQCSVLSAQHLVLGVCSVTASDPPYTLTLSFVVVRIAASTTTTPFARVPSTVTSTRRSARDSLLLTCSSMTQVRGRRSNHSSPVYVSPISRPTRKPPRLIGLSITYRGDSTTHACHLRVFESSWLLRVAAASLCSLASLSPRPLSPMLPSPLLLPNAPIATPSPQC